MTARIPRSLPIAALMAVALTAAGEVHLFDDRIDRQEVTELRFTVPAGRVITGLGFRAHYDNLTTMYIRHHRLTPEGALVDPQETRRGSEPDHECEGRVDLPEGWVAVGLGAAGEPEWDVTLVRVWGRPLNADGTLGEMKMFNAGFKPERGPERYVLLEEPDRVLTGAGLRFHSNDINGVYGRSQRVLLITNAMKARLRPFETRGWSVDTVDEDLVLSLARDLVPHEANRVDARLGDNPAEWAALRRLARVGKGRGFGVHGRVDAAGASAAKEALEAVPELAGVVADLGMEPGQLESLRTVCAETGRSFAVRADRWDAAAAERLRPLPNDVPALLPPKAFGAQIGVPGPRDLLVELDPAGVVAARAALPDVRIEEAASILASAALSGANGYVVRVQAGDLHLPDTLNALGLQALPLLARDPFQSTDAVWDTLCSQSFPAAAQEAKAALQLAAAANELTFSTLGVQFLSENGNVRTIAGARSALRDQLAAGPDPRKAASIRRLLAPTDQDVKDAEGEKKTALWLIRQTLANARAVQEKEPSELADRLVAESERLEAAAPFRAALARAYMMTQLYEVDIAPRTYGAAEGALDALKEHGQNVPAEGVDEFIASARASLEEAPGRSPLSRALQQVESLVLAGKDEEAAAAFRDIFQTEDFGPHLAKHDERLGEIATSLRALWQPNGVIRSVRGADGQWRIAEAGDRFCWSTGDRAPCIYFDVIAGPLDPPEDYVLTFDYFDEGDVRLWLNYDSDYPGEASERQYRPVDPVQLTNSRTWKTVSRELTNSLFSNSQNVLADMRFLADDGKTVWIRNLRLEKKP